MSDMNRRNNASTLETRHITVGYHGSPVPILVDESVRILSGKINVLIGPNGSGKSTLLKALVRQLRPTSGDIVLDGNDIRSLTPLQMAAKIGVLFQENSAPGDITVEELVYYSRYSRLHLFEALTEVDHQAVERALQLTGTAPMRKTLVSNLSSGQRQLAWIALLLAQTPEFFFLDEPTTFLDLAHQFEVLDCIRKLNRELNATIIMIVHDLNLAMQYADQIFVLKDGKSVRSGAPHEVITPELLREVFGIEAKVLLDEGVSCCIPLSRR